MNNHIRNHNTMKKTTLLIAALCLVLAACHETKTETPKDNFSINTIQVNDSMQYTAEQVEEWGDWLDTDKAYFFAEMDLPVTNNAALKDAIETYLMQFSNNWSMNPDDAMQVEFGDGLSMLQTKKDDFFANEGPSSESITYDKVVDSTDKYVTYIHERSYYPCGAAHGGYSVSGTTFKKENGKTFSWDMFTDKDMALEMVKYAILEQYFEVNLDEFNEEDLYDYFDLVGWNGEEGLELPATEPWIEKGKMIAVYQEYEVCNYSFGTPACILNYDEIKDFLTEEGRAYFE